MRFDIMSGGEPIRYCSGGSLEDAVAETQELIAKGKLKKQPEYIRGKAYMIYHYYNLDGSENHEKTVEELINAGFGGYLSGKSIRIS